MVANKDGNKGSTGPGKGSQTRNQRQNPYVPVTNPKDVIWAPGGKAGRDNLENRKGRGSATSTETLRRAMLARLMKNNR